MGQQCRQIDIETGKLSSDEYLPGTANNVAYHQKRMMALRDQLYNCFQMRTCDVCCERRWWKNEPDKQKIPQRYIKPLNESNMYPSGMQRRELQKQFDKLSQQNGQPTYKLCERALEAAHRVQLTDESKFVCLLCSDLKAGKTA